MEHLLQRRPSQGGVAAFVGNFNSFSMMATFTTRR